MAYTVKIDPDKMKKWIQSTGFSGTYLSSSIGKSNNYLSAFICNGYISMQSLMLLERDFNLKRADIVPDDPKKESAIGFSLTLQVKPDKVRVGVCHNGNEVYHGWSKIKGDREVDLFQAISYATHMCFKQAEQNELSEG